MAKRFYNLAPTADNFRSIWDQLHALKQSLDEANATIVRHNETLTTVQSTSNTAQRNALQALIASSGSPKVPVATRIAGSGGNPSGGGPPPGPPGPPPPVPPPGVGTCAGAPLSLSLPSWFYNALVAAGQSTTSNCLNEGLLGNAGVEGACNANDFTVQRDSGCNTRARLYHQGNHGLWRTFCGQPDASQVADYIVNVSISYGDGSQGWGWV